MYAWRTPYFGTDMVLALSAVPCFVPKVPCGQMCAPLLGLQLS